jgi:hypothetical protein
MFWKSFIMMFFSLVLVALVLQPQAFAQDLKKYRYENVVSPDETEDDGSDLMYRKKKKGKKPASPPSQPQPQIDQAPACNPPECVIQDPVLPDEICNNDCPQGSGSHCQGRHNMFTHELYAICVPD